MFISPVYSGPEICCVDFKAQDALMPMMYIILITVHLLLPLSNSQAED
jgi:hypothetical protein